MVSVSLRACPRRGTGDVHIAFHLRQRRFGAAPEVHVYGEGNRKVFFRYGLDAALIAIDNGYGTAPVALARDEPVLYPEIDFPPADTFFFGVNGNFFNRFPVVHSVERDPSSH